MAGVAQFDQRVYAVARTIPAGATLSYGELPRGLATAAWRARWDRRRGKIRSRSSCRATACWRPAAGGGFSAAGGVTTKLRLLEIEGAQVGEAPTLFENLPLLARPGRR